MALAKVSEEDLLERIAEVFRTNGYEGASLSMLSKATGLEKASLYHRFPGGKEDMAAAVVARTVEWFGQRMVPVLRGTDAPATKARKMAAALEEFYRKGTLGCIIEALSLGESTPGLREKVQAAYAGWLAIFTEVAREAGHTPSAAKVRAQKAIIELQGALVYARVTSDAQPFERAVQQVPEILAGPKA